MSHAKGPSVRILVKSICDGEHALCVKRIEDSNPTGRVDHGYGTSLEESSEFADKPATERFHFAEFGIEAHFIGLNCGSDYRHNPV